MMGCELAQGFLYYRPLPEDQIERLLASQGLSARLQSGAASVSGDAGRDGLAAA